jgi:hypothetical protein
MPPVIAAIVTIYEVYGLATAVMVVVMAASIAYTAYAMSNVPDMPGYSSEVRGRTQVVRSAVQPHRIIYGQCVVSGPLAYVLYCGENNKFLYLVIILASHEVESIDDVWLGDKLSTDAAFQIDVPGKPAEGYYQINEEGYDVWIETVPAVPPSTRPAVSITKYLGAAGQTADSSLITDSGGQWTAAHTLDGLAYLVVKLEYVEGMWPYGIPNVKALVHGKKVYDPRTETTAYSDNWALCILDYLQGAYGLNCSASDINTASFIAAANICDEVITLADGGTEHRYTCNGEFTVDRKPIDIIKNLLTGAAGNITWSQGQYKCHPAAYSAPVFTLDEDDLRSELTIQPAPSRREKFNTVRGTYVSPANFWQQTDFPPVKNSVALAADGQELPQNIELPYTISPAAAQRLAKIHLERELQGITVVFPAKLTAMAIEPMDVVRLNISRLGWVNKEFRVMDWKLASEGGIDLFLREESAASYNWNSGMETVTDPAPNTTLPDPWTVVAPTAITFGEELYATNVASVVKARAKLWWKNNDVTAVAYIIKLNGLVKGEVKDTSAVIEDMEPGTYLFEACAVNSFGRQSSFTARNITINGKTTPPADVAGFTVTANKSFVDLSWASNTELDIDSYEIRMGASWDAGTLLVADLKSSFFTWQPNTAGSMQFWIKVKDTSGNYSQNAATQLLAINAPILSGLIQQVIDNNVLLQWTATPGTFAIEYAEIRRGLDFNTATVVGKVNGTFATVFETAAGTYKYWVVLKDIAGLSGTPASLYATVAQPPDFVLRDQRNLNPNWAGTKNNCQIDIDGSLVCLVNITETFQQHFDNHSWATPQAQVDSGNTLFIQPNSTPGYYEETIDYGATIASTRILMDVTRETPAGTVTITPKISVKLNVGDAWTDYNGVYQVYATNFRYVKYRLDFSSADNGVLRITNLLTKLDSKQKTIQGEVAVVSTDSGGTSVDITGQFMDVQSITLTPKGTTAAVAIYDFTDVPNPTSFKILLFNSSGTRISGTVSYILRGV